VVNADSGLVDPIVEGLAAQVRRLGRPYCPCRDADGGEADRDIVCPCVYAAPDIGETGQCFCGLYLAPGKDPGEVGSIPERRPERA
jgi:ferredoxin-thioredoxin reductase catalytic subunit